MIGPEPWNSELRKNSCICYVLISEKLSLRASNALETWLQCHIITSLQDPFLQPASRTTQWNISRSCEPPFLVRDCLWVSVRVLECLLYSMKGYKLNFTPADGPPSSDFFLKAYRKWNPLAQFEPRHENRDTNDMRIVLRIGQSKLCMSICNVLFAWHRKLHNFAKRKDAECFS